MQRLGQPFTWEGRQGCRGTGWVWLESGIGKVNTAFTLTRYASQYPVDRVLLFGIAGAYPRSGLQVGQLALASLEIQADLGLRQGGLQTMGFPALTVEGQTYFNHFPLDQLFTEQLAHQLALAPQPFLTRDLVAETPQEALDLEQHWGAVLENMEGAAAAQVGLALGLPVAELRSISNPAGVRDRAQWDFGLALAALERALFSLIPN